VTSDNSTSLPQLASLFRGLYNRVARQLGVDPSYVSRVARGERESQAVLTALTREIRSLLDGVDHRDGVPFDGKARMGRPSAITAAPMKPIRHVLDGASRRNGGASSGGKSKKRKSSFASHKAQYGPS
jgi:hypothetical protein